MPTIVDCPSCDRKLRVTEELLGKVVQCPSCGQKFEAAGSVAGMPPPNESAGVTTAENVPLMPAPGPPAGAAIRAEPPPAGNGDFEPCPFCEKPVRRDALRCGHCGEELEEEMPPWEQPGALRRDVTPHRGPLLLVLGILSIVFVPMAMCCGVIGIAFALAGVGLGTSAWVMGHRDLRKMRQNQLDPRGKGLTTAGWICGIVGTLLSLLGMLVSLVLVAFYLYTLFWTANVPATPVPAPTPVPTKGKDKLERARPDEEEMQDEP